MRFFTLSSRATRKRSSHLAMAIALATGGAVMATAVAEPAYAQKKKKKKKKEEKAAYSAEFIGAYKPLEEVMNAEGGDLNAAKGLIPALTANIASPDEKYAGGNVVYNIGARTQDRALQLQGMKLMLESGKATPEQIPQFNFIAYQLENVAGNFSGARPYLQTAIETNFSNPNISGADLRVAMAELYFSENRFAEGLDYLASAIRERRSAGQPIDEEWYRRGLGVAYNNEVQPQVYEIATMWVTDFPSNTNWRDAINMARNLNTFEAPEMLDLLRLSFVKDTLQTKQEYIDYIDAADARRLPKEVETVINQGYASGRVSKDDIFVADSLSQAKGRIAADRAELPSLESDARSSGAGLRTVVAAGDAFLSYGQYAKAEEFYSKALGLPGADTALVTTRLGISQVHQGKYDAAQATLAKVNGKRYGIAKLWSTYAAAEAAKKAPVAMPAAASDAVETATTTS